MRIVTLILGLVLLGAATPAARGEEPAPSIVIRPQIGPEERAQRDAEARRRWERSGAPPRPDGIARLRAAAEKP